MEMAQIPTQIIYHRQYHMIFSFAIDSAIMNFNTIGVNSSFVSIVDTFVP